MTLYNDDCLTVMTTFPDESIDMIYLDPPFYTQKRQTLADSSGRRFEFSDLWESRNEYLAYMRVRLVEMRRVLKDSGSIFLHCDLSAVHYLRIILDEIFGEQNLRSEIVWTYKRWSNSAKGLTPGHQTILYYSKTDQYKFHTIYGEYSPTTNLDQLMQERERDPSGKVVYKRDQNGHTQIAREKKGVPLSDVWEIPFLNPKAKERAGYPTQKPVELLERVVRVSTDEGDVVLDPFCGSGTTLVAAKLLGRIPVGIDVNPDAIELTQKRLATPFKTVSRLLKTGPDSYRTKSSRELAILNLLDCDVVQRNKGIDAFLKKRYAGAPVAVKLQRQDESFVEAVALLNAAGKKKGCAMTIIIPCELDWRRHKSVIPENMVVVERFDSQLKRAIELLDPQCPPPFQTAARDDIVEPVRPLFHNDALF